MEKSVVLTLVFRNISLHSVNETYSGSGEFQESTSTPFTQHKSSTGNEENFTETRNARIRTTSFASRQAENVMVVVLIAVALYIMAAAICYQLKYGQNNLKWTNRICTFCSTSFLFQCGWFYFEVRSTLMSDTLCIIYAAVCTFLAVLHKVLVYLVLWMRQRCINGCSNAQDNTATFLRAVNYITLYGFILISVCEFALLLVEPVTASRFGCVLPTAPPLVQIATPIVYALSTVFMFLLLALVLVPLVRHLRARQSRPGSTLKHVIVRLSASTSICVVSDMSFLAVAVNPPDWASTSFVPIVFAFNTVLNIVALFSSFSDHKLRLFPFHLRCNTDHSEVIA